MRVCSYLFIEVVIYWKTSVFQIQIEGDCFETLNYAEHFEKLASHQHFWITSVFLNFLLLTMKIWPPRTKKYNVPEESFQPLAICFFPVFELCVDFVAMQFVEKIADQLQGVIWI